VKKGGAEERRRRRRWAAASTEAIKWQQEIAGAKCKKLIRPGLNQSGHPAVGETPTPWNSPT